MNLQFCMDSMLVHGWWKHEVLTASASSSSLLPTVSGEESVVALTALPSTGGGPGGHFADATIGDIEATAGEDTPAVAERGAGAPGEIGSSDAFVFTDFGALAGSTGLTLLLMLAARDKYETFETT